MAPLMASLMVPLSAADCHTRPVLDANLVLMLCKAVKNSCEKVKAVHLSSLQKEMR